MVSPSTLQRQLTTLCPPPWPSPGHSQKNRVAGTKKTPGLKRRARRRGPQAPRPRVACSPSQPYTLFSLRCIYAFRCLFVLPHHCFLAVLFSLLQLQSRLSAFVAAKAFLHLLLAFWKTDFQATAMPTICCAAAPSKRPLVKSFLSISPSFARSRVATICVSTTGPTVRLACLAMCLGIVPASADHHRFPAHFVRAATRCFCSSALMTLIL